MKPPGLTPPSTAPGRLRRRFRRSGPRRAIRLTRAPRTTPTVIVYDVNNNFAPQLFSHEDIELFDEVRTGGMAAVQRAAIRRTGEQCAVKHPKGEGDSAATESFNRELQALCDLEHLSIARLLGIYNDGSRRALVLEWLDETLADRIAAVGPMQ